MKKYRVTKEHPFLKEGFEFGLNNSISNSYSGGTSVFVNELELHPTWFEEIDSRWKPRRGEKYYRIAISGTTGIGEPTWHERQEDYKRWEMGNVFRTKELAEQARDKVRSLLLSLNQ